MRYRTDFGQEGSLTSEGLAALFECWLGLDAINGRVLGSSFDASNRD